MENIKKVIKKIINDTILSMFMTNDISINTKLTNIDKLNELGEFDEFDEFDNLSIGNGTNNINNIDNTNPNNELARVFECGLCNSKSHSITKCFKYRELKKNLTNSNYINLNANKLNSNEENGFCASGIIPYVKIENKVYLLVLVEKRQNKIGLNFIGGKRECIKENGIIRGETSWETAKNELSEELGEILRNETAQLIIEQITKCSVPNFVFWSGQSKMSLYGIKLPNNFLFSLILNDRDKTKTEAQGYKWVAYNGKEYNKKNPPHCKFHPYSKSILNDMKKLISNNDLNNLFI